MPTVAVANPRAANGKVERDWQSYERLLAERFGAVELQRTTAPGDATRLVRQALGAGAERIVAVGGDGTLNEAVNGFFAPDGAPLGKGAELALLPAGTGGDFSRSVGLSNGSWLQAMRDATPRAVDVGRATFVDGSGRPATRHFVNISSFGASGLIVDRVNRTTKALGGKTSFLLGTLRGLAAYRPQRVRLRIDDAFEEEVQVTIVAAANGRFFGGSMMIAPEAVVDDGLFDVIVVAGIGPVDFVRYSPRLYAGKHIGLPGIRQFRGRKVTATPLGGELLIDLDGEQPGRLPVTYEVVPRAVKLLAPWEKAAAV